MALHRLPRLDPGAEMDPSSCEIDEAVTRILEERQLRSIETIHALWRTGDIVNQLKSAVPYGCWRRTVQACANRAGVHAKWLDEAARVSAAFGGSDRDRLIKSIREAGAILTASHIVELARVGPLKRAKGIEALLRAPHSVRELRACLRGTERR
jgi:hypothetical protein